MRPLYLIRHASPIVRPGEPARDWPLSERGIAEAQTLAGTASLNSSALPIQSLMRNSSKASATLTGKPSASPMISAVERAFGSLLL